MNIPNRVFAVMAGILLSGCKLPRDRDEAIPLCASFAEVSSTDPSGYFTDAAYFRICVKEPDDCFRRAFQIVKGGNFRLPEKEMVHPRPIDMAYWWYRRTGILKEFEDESKHFQDFRKLSEAQSLAASAIQVIVPDDLYSRCFVFFNREPIAVIRDGTVRFTLDPSDLSYAPIQSIMSDAIAGNTMHHWHLFDSHKRGSRYGHADSASVRYFAKPQTLLEPGNFLLLECHGEATGLVGIRARLIRSDRFSISVYQGPDCMFVRKGIWCYVDPILDPDNLTMTPPLENPTFSVPDSSDFKEVPIHSDPEVLTKGTP